MATDNPAFNEPDQNEKWLTVYEVAGQLLARPDTVKTWVREGMLPAEERGRRGLRIPKKAVDDFIIRHFQSEGFRAADHSLSSSSAQDILSATEIPEQAVERQGAGWPFRRDEGENEPDFGGHRQIPGGL
jgi:excisionase family DNA binding protein